MILADSTAALHIFRQTKGVIVSTLTIVQAKYLNTKQKTNDHRL